MDSLKRIAQTAGRLVESVKSLVHEKVLSITHHLRNQSHSEIRLTTVRMPIIKELNKKVGEDVEKREILCTVGENINWHSHCGKNSIQVPQKTKNRSTM